MRNVDKMAEIKKLSRARVLAMKFGDPVTNVCAGENNPHRLGYFVRYKYKHHQVEVTDGKGVFGYYGAEVIYSGHLDYDECKKLFAPICDALYGG